MIRDYSRDYEWDERCCYPHSVVLKRKLGIMDAETFRTAECEFTSLQIARAKKEVILWN